MKKFTKFILISFFFLFSLFDLKAAQENGIPFIARRNMEKFSGPRVYELDNLTSIGEILSTSA